MSENRMRARRIENYKEYIRNILSNRDIDCDETWWDSEEAQKALNLLVRAEKWEICSSVQMGIDSSENFLFLKFTNKNVNIKIDIFSCFYRFAILHNTQPVLLYIFTFRQRNSKAATPASLSRSLYPLLCKLLYLFLE